MKPFLFLMTAMLFVSTAFAQHLPQTEQPTKEYYLKKAKTNKIAAWTLVGAGVGMTLSGIAINFGSWGEGNQNNGLWLSYVGAGTTLLSIPCFINAYKNKRRAKALNTKAFLKPEVNNIAQFYKTANNYPAVGLQIKF